MKYYILSLIICSFLMTHLSAQNKHSGYHLQRIFADRDMSSRSIRVGDFFERMSDEMKLNKDSRMLLSRKTSLNQSQHYRYQQYHDGIPVFANQLILHAEDGLVRSVNGLYTPEIRVNTIPGISASSAGSRALEAFDRASDPSPLKKASDAKVTGHTLVIIDRAFPAVSGDMQLAFSIDVLSETMHKKTRYMIDAQHGEMIFSYPLFHTHGVPGKAVTKYYGVQNIICDSIDVGHYELRDRTRGDGINIFNKNGSIFRSETRDWDLTNGLQDEVALDAMYCTEQFYDLLTDRFGWDGLDGQGMAMNTIVHRNDLGVVNAFWDGTNANFGDGNCRYGPLTTMEVLGHEFTHGIIEFTSGLVYAGESGALNESIADMFGQALEYHGDQQNFSWSLGSSFALDPQAPSLRVMDDPNSVNMPAYYKGLYWIDNNDVHYNSSIGNLWFVYLTDGAQGVNEGGQDFDITGIGIEKALAVVFYANRDYNVPSTDYNTFRINTLKSAADLFGQSSPEYLAVDEAWKAVGLPQTGSEIKRDLGITNTSIFETSCDRENFLPITLIISNNGQLAYLPDEGAAVTLYATNLPTRTIPLDEEILPGQSKTLFIDDWAQYAGYNFENYNFEIVWADDNFENNYAFKFLEFKTYEENDISVFVYNVGSPGCVNASAPLKVNIFNNSCKPVPTGSAIRLQIQDSNLEVLYDDIHQLNAELRPSAWYEIEVPVILQNEGLNTFTCTGELADDPDPSNNVSSLELYTQAAISDEYSQDFESLPSPIAELKIVSPVHSISVIYQGSQWLGFTGFFNDTFNLQHCRSPEAIFEQTEYMNGTVSACVDFSGSTDNSVEFDAIFYRSRYSEENSYPYSSMIRVTWSGNETGSAIFYGGDEGVRQHFVTDLPADFVGNITIQLFAELGNSFIDAGSFLNDDIVMFDNLKFNKKKLDVHDPAGQGNFTIYPNPVTSALHILHSTPEQLTSYRLINSLGNVIREYEPTIDHIDLSHLAPGVYTLAAYAKGRAPVLKKFVKI